MEQSNNGIFEDFTEPQVNPEGFFNDLTSQNACSVRVAVRVRPLIGRELNESGIKTCVDVDSIQNKLLIGEKNFQFDRVFSSDSEQREIFDVCARNLVLGCFAGYNATILAYGQTGSGKTHSMGTGSTNGLSEEQIGIVPRVFKFIFEELDRRKQQSSFSEFAIKISFLELYNEELHDLLDPSAQQLDRVTGKPLKELQIKEKNGNISVHNLKEEPVNNKEECLTLLNKGISHRTTSATLMNEGSSRSHAIFTIAIEQRIIKPIDEAVENLGEAKPEGLPSQQEEQITAKFHFVDLAGSERIKRTGATGQLMKEGISINKGLLCLGNVISALTDEKQREKHIPYRDSKLTRILQDSLGGNSRTTMIACVSPADSNYEETLNSIKYASRARNIKNKPVVNRDPNSLLIDSLRQQISGLQGEIVEYQNILKSNNIPIPENFSDSVQKRVDENKKQPQKPANLGTGTINNENLNSQGNFNFSELRDVKIKLSRKEKELKELQDQLQQQIQKVAQKDQEIAALQKERDNLRLKNEILSEHMQNNNLQLENLPNSDNTKTLSLIDEYKQKLEKMEKELERKNQEMQAKSRNIAELQIQSQRDEEVLRKHLEENQRLKRQLKKFEEQQTSGAQALTTSPPSSTKARPNLRLNLQGISQNGATSLKHQKSTSILPSDKNNEQDQQKRKTQLQNIMIDAEDLNQKFINNLTNQLESLFLPTQDDEFAPLNSSRSIKSNKVMNFDPENLQRTSSAEDMLANALQDSSNLLEDDNQIAPVNNALEEKEKILGTVKTSVKQMQSELIELMKHEYEKKIEDIENNLKQMDNEKQATLKKTTDSKQIQQIEQQYKQKMDEMNKQLALFKEKEKKQEIVSKQISIQEKKIKNLEEDITKYKNTKEQIETKMKQETEKFSKFKQSVNKELTNAKKLANDKDKEVQKLKKDLKQTDNLAQKKIAELRGLQKRVYEDRMKREMEKREDYEKKGIDIDMIKDWINENTDRMLLHNELKEQLDQQVAKKERIEDEMLLEGEKLTEIMLQKERKEIEKSQLELESEPDEGKILELEEELYQLHIEMQNITENLDSLDETLTFTNKKANQLTEEVIALDIDNIQPLKFSGLQSVDAARVTLQTFFCVLLDINIYKRDLENKCIEQDETVLELNDQIKQLQAKMEQLLIQQGNTSGLPTLNQNDSMSRLDVAQKEKAIKSIVDTLDGFVEYQDLKNLNLTPNESTTLTKLSLSKIVSNLKQKLKEEETKNQSLSHKLEQANSEREQFKLRYDNLRKKAKNDQIVKDPLAFKEQQNQQQQDKETKFSSLANARNTRRGVTNNQTTDQSENNGGDTSSNTTVTTLKSVGGAQNSMSATAQKLRQNAGKIRMLQGNLGNANQDSINKPEIKGRNGNNLNQMHSLPNNRQTQQIKRPNTQLGQRKSSSLERLPIKERLQKQAPTLSKRNPRKMESFQPADSNFSSNSLQPAILKKPNLPINETKQKPSIHGKQTSVQVPSFKDRRNQRKMENNEDLGKVEPEKVQEIDKIKEGTFLITHNQQHMDRRQSRARAFSKKIHTRGLSSGGKSQNNMNLLTQDRGFGMQNIKDFEENDQEESPRVSRSPKKLNKPNIDTGYMDNMQSNTFEDESFMMDSVLSPSKDVRNKWTHDELAQLESHGQRLIGCDYIGDRIILVFDDFTIREILIDTLEETITINLFEMNGAQYNGELAVDIACDKELNLLAVTSANIVYMFDYTDSYKLINQIQVENIQQVVFCQYNVIVMVNLQDSVCIVAYQVDDGSELGMYEVITQGYQAIMRTDNQFIYLSCGIRMHKFTVPELQPLYIIDTSHSDVIKDFHISSTAIVTTSQDQSLRAHDIETGEECVNPLEGLACDHIDTERDFIFTRIGEGQGVLVWRHQQYQEDLILLDEIPLELPEEEVIGFKMKGKIIAKLGNGVNYNLVLLITCLPEVILVNALKHKLLSEL